MDVADFSSRRPLKEAAKGAPPSGDIPVKQKGGKQRQEVDSQNNSHTAYHP